MNKRNCLDCIHSYIEDLYLEICCGINKKYIGDMHIYERAKNCEHYERIKRKRTKSRN